MWIGGECRLILLIDLLISSKINELYAYENGTIDIDVEENQDASWWVMCSCNLYFNDELIMEDVIIVEKKGDKIIAIDIFGEKKELVGEIVKVDLNENKIFIRG